MNIRPPTSPAIPGRAVAHPAGCSGALGRGQCGDSECDSEWGGRHLGAQRPGGREMRKNQESSHHHPPHAPAPIQAPPPSPPPPPPRGSASRPFFANGGQPCSEVRRPCWLMLFGLAAQHCHLREPSQPWGCGLIRDSFRHHRPGLPFPGPWFLPGNVNLKSRYIQPVKPQKCN